jgi:hypothetical protein
MAFVYEVNGQRVEFEKEPTEKDIDEAARNLGRPKPESQRKVTETGGGAAIILPNITGRRPESQQDREAAKEMPVQTARGVVTGTLGAIPDLLNLPGQIYGAATNQPAPYKVPLGSEEWNQMLPGQSDTPHANLARFAGQALAPIPTVKGIQTAIKAPGQVMRTGREVTQGAMEGLRNPTYQRSAETSFAPLEQTYYPAEQVKQFQSLPEAQRPGMLPELQASQQSSQSLFNTPGQLLAKALGPKTAQGQNLIPYQGETARAFGETVGRDIATSPFKTTGIPSIAGATIGTLAGGPIGGLIGAGVGAMANPLVRGAELFALNKLGKTAGFIRGFPEELAQAQQLAGRQGLQANMPPAPGPVAPMIASPSGQVTAPGGRPLPTQASGQPVTQPQGPTPQQMAIQKTQEIVAQRQARPQQVAGPVEPQPLAPQARTPLSRPQPQPTPKVEGVRSSSEIRKELDMIGRQSDELHGQGLESGIKYGTPEGESYQAQLGQLSSRARILEKELEQALKAEKTATKQIAKKKAPSNVSQMLTDEQAKMWNTLKQPENISPVEKRISEMTQANRDKLEDSLLNQLMDMDVSRASKELVSQQLNIIGKYRIK